MAVAEQADARRTDDHTEKSSCEYGPEDTSFNRPDFRQGRRRKRDRLDIETIHDKRKKSERENGALHGSETRCIQDRADIYAKRIRLSGMAQLVLLAFTRSSTVRRQSHRVAYEDYAFARHPGSARNIPAPLRISGKKIVSFFS
jgi:hypothetical protein